MREIATHNSSITGRVVRFYQEVDGSFSFICTDTRRRTQHRAYYDADEKAMCFTDGLEALNVPDPQDAENVESATARSVVYSTPATRRFPRLCNRRSEPCGGCETPERRPGCPFAIL